MKPEELLKQLEHGFRKKLVGRVQSLKRRAPALLAQDRKHQLGLEAKISG
jgi:hypothetical protein